MEVEVEELYNQLHLTKLEKETIFIDASLMDAVVEKGSQCLLAKLHTTQPYNWEAFKATMKKFWRKSKLVKFHEMGLGVLLIQFDEKMDRDKVIRESPWNVDKNMILLQKYDSTKQVCNLSLTKASFWVRVHDLPLGAPDQWICEMVQMQ